MKRTNFEEILKEVKDFQRTADRIFSEYYKKVSKMKAELRDEVFQKELRMNVYPYYSGTLMAERTAAKSNIHAICESIADDLKDWTLKPIKPETMQILNCINSFNIRLTKDELSILESDVRENLFAAKIFSEIARKNGYLASMPDATGYLKALRITEADACLAVDAYCGSAPDFPGRDLLDKHRINGVAVGEYEIWHRMYAANYAEKHSSLDEAAGMWEQSKVDISYTLTESERSRIKKMIDEVEQMDEAGKATKMISLLEAEKDLPDKLRLMGDDYREYATKYAAAEQSRA